MEKGCHSSAEITTNNSKKDHYLKQLNKTSHKISKPTTKNPFEHPPQNPNNQRETPSHQNPSNQQPQPPVYNINKNDFRNVVQKLTGSPSHHLFSNPNPPPIHTPKPQNSRLQKIRPPPLVHVSTNPPTTPPSNDPSNPNRGFSYARPRSPFSPLPPFPTVNALAESPISAYMRYLQTSDMESRRNSGFSPLPEWNAGNFPAPAVAMSSPVGFGRLSSPRSPYPLLSPSFLFSPTSQLGLGLGFPPLPPSPRLQVPSPRWRGL
ncbi:VQ motif-containing protein 9-like [Tasmannia lanceolata]|uniref:VQ motif-containing protein 9-like n=1 Tax=Tasmannia lanceolata TaxID=3420 RepID=UPI004062E4E7